MSPLFPYETLSYDPGAVTRGERGRLARVFIAGTLLPAMSDLPPDKTFTNKELEELLNKFQTEHPEQGNDFDMGNVQHQITKMYLEYEFSAQHGHTLEDHTLVEKTFNRLNEYIPTSK